MRMSLVSAGLYLSHNYTSTNFRLLQGLIYLPYGNQLCSQISTLRWMIAAPNGHTLLKHESDLTSYISEGCTGVSQTGLNFTETVSSKVTLNFSYAESILLFFPCPCTEKPEG
jgi:hypothetical protein